ncbi:hypothetical protein TNIN_207371 [Trichonephila inaurata madagascariensis]|uniref:Uncharacterized protein n=1 Tax=Trichonephila inaurata madagascariensis TaxID=2747483 RepID=A0A8X6Y2X7_9ARAC|nr:hypothetical protein TNIN_207371 [Trichonephila inaurata madagascariensis]
MRSFLHLSCRVVIKAHVTKRDKTYGPLISQEVANEGSHHVKRVITPATLSLLGPSANEGVFVRVPNELWGTHPLGWCQHGVGKRSSARMCGGGLNRTMLERSVLNEVKDRF